MAGATSPADGPILGALYGSDAMRAVFDEAAFFRRMLEVEAALGREAAHHAVKNACDRALAEGCTLAEALAREPAVAARAFIDRVIEAANRTLG